MSCPECFSGHVHDGEPLGNVEKLYGRNTYISEPKEGAGASKGTIVFICDAFGWEFVNNRILADHYAARTGYTVLTPDFLNGKAAPVKTIDLMGQMAKASWFKKPILMIQLIIACFSFMVNLRWNAKVKEVRAYLEAIRVGDKGAQPLGVAGFCWGGKMCFMLGTGEKASNGRPLIDSIFTGHPSAIKVPAEVEKLRVPFSIAIGDKDMQMNLKQIEETERILNAIDGLKSEVVLYKGGVEHGFCVRAEFGSKSGSAADESESQAVKWFMKTLDGVKHA